MSRGKKKHEALLQVKILYLLHPEGLSDAEIAKALDIDVVSAYRYRQEIGCKIVAHGRYTYEPNEKDIEFAQLIMKRMNKMEPGQFWRTKFGFRVSHPWGQFDDITNAPGMEEEIISWGYTDMDEIYAIDGAALKAELRALGTKDDES